MLAVVHNKLSFPVYIARVVIEPHGTKKIDLPDGFKYDLKKISVSYIKENVIDESEKVVETEIKKPMVEKPKPKKKTRKRNTK